MADNQKNDHDMITEIHNTLCGFNGNGGLLKEFEKHQLEDISFRRDYYQFKRHTIGILCFAAGSGALGFSVVKIIGG